MTVRRRTLVGAMLAAPVAAAVASRTRAAGPDRAPALSVVVVGAGAFGGWTALELARRGARVTLVDGWGPGNARASSGGETRVIRAAYSDPLYVAMARRSLALWQDRQRAFGQTLYRRTGLVFMAQPPGEAFLAEAARRMSEAGVAHEVLDNTDLGRRFPQLATDRVRRALFEPDAGFLYARRACAAVADAFVQAGGVYLPHHARPDQPVNGVLRSVRLADGSVLEADCFVFACGPWLKTLFPDAAGQALKVTRQEIFYFGTPDADRRFDAGQLPVWADFGERLWYGIPANDGRGFKIADDSHGESFEPTNGQRVASAGGIEAAREYLAHRFPGLAGAPLLESRVCQYTSTPDGHFVVDRHPLASNLWLVGGGSGHGFKHGPAMGEHVAARILDEVPPEPAFSLAGRA